MKNKELAEFTTEELKSKIKTLKGIQLIMIILIALYLFFFIYKLVTGTWETGNILGIVMVGMLVVMISFTSIQYGRIRKILQNREEEE